MSNLVISQLAIYPVKSMRQVSLEKATIDMGGLKNDRRWMVVDNDGKMITQRKSSRLCLIQPELTGSGIKLRVPDVAELSVAIPDGTAACKAIVWKDICNAYDAGENAAQWLSEFLDEQCRLVYFPEDEVRTVDQNYAQAGDRTAFSDGFPVLLTTQASLDDLNSRMKVQISMARFRPNIVISGSEAYAEDEWQKLRIGNLGLRIVKPCSRCVIPSIDIETGERSSAYEPTKTLSTYRRRDNQIFFGQNAIIDGEGEIKASMSVELVK